MEQIMKMLWWWSSNEGQGCEKHCRRHQSFYCAYTKGLSTDDHIVFLVNECKVSYQSSLQSNCVSPVGTHFCTNIMKCSLPAEVCTPNADHSSRGWAFVECFIVVHSSLWWLNWNIAGMHNRLGTFKSASETLFTSPCQHLWKYIVARFVARVFPAFKKKRRKKRNLCFEMTFLFHDSPCIQIWCN